MGNNVTEICGPIDIEAHQGTDNKYYVLDTARCFPPEAPYRNFSVFRIPKGIFHFNFHSRKKISQEKISLKIPGKRQKFFFLT